MIDALNLLWIVPLSMIVGASSVICVVCVINAGNITKELEKEKDKNDNRNA